jgi:hypothetical protein
MYGYSLFVALIQQPVVEDKEVRDVTRVGVNLLEKRLTLSVCFHQRFLHCRTTGIQSSRYSVIEGFTYPVIRSNLPTPARVGCLF